jgi:hypothetical protein
LSHYLDEDRGDGVRIKLETPKKHPDLHLRVDRLDAPEHGTWLTAFVVEHPTLAQCDDDSFPWVFDERSTSRGFRPRTTEDATVPLVVGRRMTATETRDIAAAILTRARVYATTPSRVQVSSGRSLVAPDPSLSNEGRRTVQMINSARLGATVRCGVCDRPLLDEESQRLGIGPECAKRFERETLTLLRDDTVHVGRTTLDRFRRLVVADLRALVGVST